jgi:hypothetical protein
MALMSRDETKPSEDDCMAIAHEVWSDMLQDEEQVGDTNECVQVSSLKLVVRQIHVVAKMVVELKNKVNQKYSVTQILCVLEEKCGDITT